LENKKKRNKGSRWLRDEEFKRERRGKEKEEKENRP